MARAQFMVSAKQRRYHERYLREKRARAIATHTNQQWQRLLDLCGRVCLRCGTDQMNLERDHIVSLASGGSDGIDNIQPLCAPCNTSKNGHSHDYRPSHVITAISQGLVSCSI